MARVIECSCGYRSIQGKNERHICTVNFYGRSEEKRKGMNTGNEPSLSYFNRALDEALALTSK